MHALFDGMTSRLLSETDERYGAAVSFIEKELYQEVFAADHGEVKLCTLCTCSISLLLI